jgi:hypothetical protein
LGPLALKGEHAVEVILVVQAPHAFQNIGPGGIRFYKFDISVTGVAHVVLPLSIFELISAINI